MLKGMVNAYKIETRNASWLYNLFWYPAVVTKGGYTLHIWYAGKSYYQLFIPCRSDIRLISNRHAPGHFWTNYGMTRERWGIWFMANGEFIHCACLIIRKWWIRSLWNSYASHTVHKETSIYGNIFVRIDDVNTCPFLVKPPGHQWFPLTKGQWWGGFYILIVVHVNRLLN